MQTIGVYWEPYENDTATAIGTPQQICFVFVPFAFLRLFVCLFVCFSRKFLCRHCTTTTRNDQRFTLFDNRNGKAKKNYCLLLTRTRCPLFSYQLISLLSGNWATQNNREKVERMQSLLLATFSSAWPCRIHPRRPRGRQWERGKV